MTLPSPPSAFCLSACLAIHDPSSQTLAANSLPRDEEGQTRGRTGASHSLERKQPEKRCLASSVLVDSRPLHRIGSPSSYRCPRPLVAHVASCLVPGFFFPACSNPVKASPFSAGGRKGVMGRGSRAPVRPPFPFPFPWGTGRGRPLAPALAEMDGSRRVEPSLSHKTRAPTKPGSLLFIRWGQGASSHHGSG